MIDSTIRYVMFNLTLHQFWNNYSKITLSKIALINFPHDLIKHKESLKALGEPVDSWSSIFIEIALN